MRIAVTGATGFVGRYVVAELTRRGIEPTLVCRPGAVLPSDLARHPVAHLDIAAPSTRAFEAMGAPDRLIHLAWAGLPHFTSLHHFETELPAQYRFLRSLVDAGLRHCVVAGTCAEYGVQSGALREDLDTRPSNPYGLAKDALRRQLAFLQGTLPFELTWARLFYLYGEGQSPNSLLPQLQRAVREGQPEFRMSGGEQLRDYLPVAEAARVIVMLALASGAHGVVNVCSGQPISVRELVEQWIAENGWSIKPSFGHYPYPEYESIAFWGDAQRLNNITRAQDGTERT